MSLSTLVHPAGTADEILGVDEEVGQPLELTYAGYEPEEEQVTRHSVLDATLLFAAR